MSQHQRPVVPWVHKLDQLFFANSNYGRFADHQPTNTSPPPIMLDLPDLSAGRTNKLKSCQLWQSNCLTKLISGGNNSNSVVGIKLLEEMSTLL